MAEGRKIRDRYVRPGQKTEAASVARPVPTGFPKVKRDTDPKSLIFLIGFMFSADPVPEPLWHDDVGTEILVCD